MKNALINLSLKVYIKLFTDKDDIFWTEYSSIDQRTVLMNYNTFMSYYQNTLQPSDKNFLNLSTGQIELYKAMTVAQILSDITDYKICCQGRFTSIDNEHLKNLNEAARSVGYYEYPKSMSTQEAYSQGEAQDIWNPKDFI